MPATRSRCDSNRSRCVNSPMRSAPTRRSIALILRSNSNSNSNSWSRSSVIRCRTCRNSLVNSRKVRSFPASPGLGRDSVPHHLWLLGIHLTAFNLAYCDTLSSPPCSWQTHVHFLRVEGESQSPRVRPAEVRTDLFPLRVLPPPQPRAKGGGRRGEHNVHALTHMPTSYRNTSNTSPTGSGASAAGSYLAQPPSPALDRHTQQAYYAPRVSPKPQSGTINNDSTSWYLSVSTLLPLLPPLLSHLR